jgi:N-dimethylarginine dimethylaminohydrolase
MIRLCIKPTTFQILPIQHKQNPYITDDSIQPKNVNKKKVHAQHDALEKAFHKIYSFTVYPVHHEPLPDIVFVANSGLSLPRLPEPVFLLPYMKYIQRKEELHYLKQLYTKLGLRTIPFPGSANAPFEGQAEIKWFHGGTKLVCGPGFRSTRKTFEILDKVLKKIYKSYGVEPPELCVVPLQSADYYHLDVAMLEYNDTSCIIHKNAFSKTAIHTLQKFLGPQNVHILDTRDSFCLNAVCDGSNLITHKLSDPSLKKKLETITGLSVKQVDTSEFEKSGGSVRCMTLDIYPIEVPSVKI